MSLRSLRNRYRDDAGNPLQPGNALKNENFDKAFFRFNGMAVTLALVFLVLAILYIV